MLYRLGANAKMGKDSFTKYTLASALQVRPEKVEEWIASGWLERRDIAVGAGKRTVIDADAFCDFCKKHAKDVVGNRLSKERLEFVYHFVFPPSHAQLLPVRESKKEREAFETQWEEPDRETTGFGPKSSEGEDDEPEDLDLTRDPRLQRS